MRGSQSGNPANNWPAGHTETTMSGDTRADWSAAFELVPSLQIAYLWHASKYTREVLDRLLRIGFLHHQQISCAPQAIRGRNNRAAEKLPVSASSLW
jgi:hypothetical protein